MLESCPKFVFRLQPLPRDSGMDACDSPEGNETHLDSQGSQPSAEPCASPNETYPASSGSGRDTSVFVLILKVTHQTGLPANLRRLSSSWIHCVQARVPLVGVVI